MFPSIGSGTNRSSWSFILRARLLLSIIIGISSSRRQQVNSLSYTSSSSSKDTQHPQQLSSTYARNHLITRCTRNTARVLHMRRPPGHDLNYQFLDLIDNKKNDDDDDDSNAATANDAYTEQNQAVEAKTRSSKGFGLVRNLSMSFVQRVVPDSLNLQATNIRNISMPDIDYFKNLSTGNVNMNITMPDINVTIPKVSLPSMNQVDISFPWTRTKRMSQTRSDRDQFPVIIDVDAVTDKMDTDKRPLNLFGAFPELELQSNELQSQLPLWNRDRATRQKTEQSASPSSPSSSFPVLLNSAALLDTLTSSICKVTGKDTYKLGDMSRYLDNRAKDAIRGLTGEVQLQVMGLSKQVDDQIKDRINSLKLAKIQKDFNIADITRTIIQKVASGDYQLSDITFLCKVLVVLGADFSPVAGLLPVRLLLELFGYSIVIGLGERFMTAIATELDRRLERNEQKEDEKNQSSLPLAMIPLDNGITAGSYTPGDLTKQAILEYTGKNTYQTGDIAGSKMLEKASPTSTSTSTGDIFSVDIIKELEECLAMERELVEKLNEINSVKMKSVANQE